MARSNRSRAVVPAVVHLLSDHFRSRLDAHWPPFDLPPLPSRISQVWRGHEVDLAFLELQLDERARHLRVLLGQGCRRVAEPGRHVAEVLRVWHEDVDVLAEAVSVPEHQDGSASEGPERIREPSIALDVVDQPQRSLEQHLPGAGRQRLDHTHRPCRCTSSDLASFATLHHTAFGATPSFAAASSTAITTSGTGASSSRCVRWAA